MQGWASPLLYVQDAQLLPNHGPENQLRIAPLSFWRDFLADFLPRRAFTTRLMMTESQELLADYAKNGSETAFRELVARYIDLVFSTALRLVDGDAHRAQDTSQTVFMDLARQAHKLPPNTMLGGWLHRDTCFVAARVMRGERRRQLREKQAAEMNALNQSDTGLAHLAPVLDEAINELSEEDRKAILLRFYEQMDLRSVGLALGTSENAAQKRVSRALDQLQSILTRQGMTASAAALGVALAAEAVTAAPVALAANIAGAVLAGAGATAAGTLTHVVNMTKLKFGIASAIAIASVATPLVIQHHAVVQLRQDNQDLRRQLAQLASVAQEKAQLSNVLANAMAQSRNPGEPNELLRLRGEVARLRNVERELARTRQDKSGSKALEVNTSSIVEQPEQPRFIFVAGEVSTPGRFIWTNGMTLATLIELAHGYTDTANRSRAEIMDTNGLSITVNYPESSPPTASKDEIHPGVRVFIPRSDAGDGVSQ